MNLQKDQKLILAVIPARGGSKELKRKSLLKINNKSLISYAIKSSLSSKYINRTIFSSDDDEMILEAKKNGAEVLFKRPNRLATDSANTWAVVNHAVKWLEEKEKWFPDYIILLQPTTPFRNSKHIDSAFKKMFKEKRTSCISLKEVDYPPQWMFKIKNQSLEKLFKGKNISRRQDAEKIYQPNGMIYILHKKHLDEKIIFPKKDTCHIKMSQDVSINIDTEIQYQLAKTIAEKNVQKKK